MSRLFGLPRELFYHILGYLRTPHLVALVRTCRAAEEVLTPLLYGQERKTGAARSDMLREAARKGLLGTIQKVFRYNPSPSPRHMCACLAEACWQGNLEIVEFLLAAGVSVEVPQGKNSNWQPQFPPLHRALSSVSGGIVKPSVKRDIVKKLINAGADPSKDAAVCLIILSNVFHCPGSEEIFDLLLEAGLNPHQCDEGCGGLLRTILTTPSDRESRNLFLCHLLTIGIDPNTCPPGQRTALSQAVLYYSEQSVIALLAHGARTDIPDDQGNLPIHCVTSAGSAGRQCHIAHLVNAGPATQVEARNNNGRNPLSLAISRPSRKTRLPLVRELLAVGADPTAPYSNRDGNGWTILGRIIGSGEGPLIRMVLDAGLGRMPGVSPSELLLAAACVGDITVVRQLCTRSDIDIMVRTKNENRDTALMLAAGRGDDEIVKFLLASMSDADVDVRNAAGSTALHAALMSRRESTVRLVAERAKESFLTADDRWCTPLALAARCSKGSTRIIECLLSKGCSVSGTDPASHLPLRYAVMHAGMEMLRLLVAHGAAINGPTDLVVSRPLEVAVRAGREEMVEFLLDQGAEMEWTNASGERISVLPMAAKSGKLSIVKLLVSRGAPLDTIWPETAAGPGPTTALGIAATSTPPKLDLVRYLLEAGANPNVNSRRADVPLLVNVVERLQTDLLDILLETKQAPGVPSPPPLDLDVVGYRRSATALFLATQKGRIDIVETLLRHGADPNKGRAWHARTPLEMAAGQRNLPVLRLLLGHKQIMVEPLDSEGRTPFLYAARAGDLPTARALLELGKVNIHARDVAESTALILAAAGWNRELVAWLLELGVDPTARDHFGQTALDCAMNQSYPDPRTVELLQRAEGSYKAEEKPEQVRDREEETEEALAGVAQHEMEALSLT